MTGDDLAAVGGRLEDLDARPIAEHPGVLDEVHRSLVGELERLAGVVSGDGRAGRSERSHDIR